MIHQLTFGQCLQELLFIRGWSAAQLAKVLNIDASYVRRWVRGDRTPALHTSYINDITEAICDGLDREYRKATKAALTTLLDQSEADAPMGAATLRDRVQHHLHEAQIYTLSLDTTARKNRKPTEGQSVVSQLLEITQVTLRKPNHQPTLHTFPPTHTRELEQLPSVLTNREAILSAAITLLKHAVQNQDTAPDKQIYLTFQSERDYFDGYPELYHEWQQAIIHALRLGWCIHHLCRLNKNVERSLQLVNQILAWTNYSGSYHLYYFTKYGIDFPAQEIILIKGSGAITGYATDQFKEMDAGLYLNETNAVHVIEKYVEQMLRNTEPLIHILSQNDYFELNVTKDRKPGSHCMCMHDLSYLTVPPEIMKKYMSLSISDENERRVHWWRIEDTVKSFYRDIQRYPMRHIYPMRAIEMLVTTGEYDRNPYFRPTREDIQAHLLYLTELLHNYDQFEIALIDDHTYNLIHRTQFDIKGNHTVAIGVLPRSDARPKVELIAITEGTIVRAFQDYFDDIWERINPIYRDKQFVSSWIKDKLALL
ncbi:hypothetical protein D3C74_174230 [compost metagenome]